MAIRPIITPPPKHHSLNQCITGYSGQADSNKKPHTGAAKLNRGWNLD
jgi:hypothetical protein